MHAGNGERFFLLAAITAAVAAVFIVAIWAPLQAHAFVEAVGTSSGETINERPDWMHAAFTALDGKATNIAESNGTVRIVTMLYTHCPGMCPMAVATLQNIESRLTSEQKKQLTV